MSRLLELEAPPQAMRMRNDEARWDAATAASKAEATVRIQMAAAAPPGGPRPLPLLRRDALSAGQVPATCGSSFFREGRLPPHGCGRFPSSCHPLCSSRMRAVTVV